MHQSSAGPFRFELHASGLSGAVVRFGARLFERALSFPALNDIYARTRECCGAGGFSEGALRAMGVRVQVAPGELARIPKQGPLVVVANHPFGGVEGLALSALIRRVRPDVRLLANYLLARMPEMHEEAFFVDPFGGRAAAERNLASMKAALRWVQRGGALGVFPSGEVSHATWRHPSVTDPAWSDTVARIARRTEATVVPVYFGGRNSGWFQLAGLIHPRLRTALLPREFVNKAHASLVTRVGTAISPSRLARFDEPRELTEYLRARTYLLKGRGNFRAVGGGPASAVSSDERRSAQAPSSAGECPAEPVHFAPVVTAGDARSIAREIHALPADRTLVSIGEQRVLRARSWEIPRTLREIGRLREETFRKVGEGTGREIDLDRYDEHYHHLFVWNAESSRIIGAYRLGATDEILPEHGVSGLYTSTLFDFKPALLTQINPALELGRSFVVDDFQRSYTALLLLWRGIGRFVCMNPRYRLLFGTVSISDDYQSMTKQLLLTFLSQRNYRSRLADLVRPKNPPRFRQMRRDEQRRVTAVVHSLDEVDELVSDIESDRRGMPVLLRQYMRMNAKILGFNIDPDFGDVLDGLVLIDLAQADRALLNKYFGKAETAEFLSHHQLDATATDSKPRCKFAPRAT